MLQSAANLLITIVAGGVILGDSTYAPVYKYSGKEYPLSAELIALLKEAAQQLRQ